MNAVIHCALCEAHAYAVPVDGETHTETDARARQVAIDAGYVVLAPRGMRDTERLVCDRCAVEVWEACEE